jgi:translation elongation factor EF-4
MNGCLCCAGSRELPSRALIVDSWYDKYRGAALLVALSDGSFHIGQNITISQSEKSYEIKEIGVLSPTPKPLHKL